MQKNSMSTLLTMTLHINEDVVKARQRARQISALLGFDTQGQTRIATAVSEIARNTVCHAQKGKVEYGIVQQALGTSLGVRITDKGPGIPSDKLTGLLTPQAKSSNLYGIQRIMDCFEITSSIGDGTTVWMEMYLPKNASPVTHQVIAKIAEALTRYKPDNVSEEVQQQNHELLHALALLNKARDELEERVEERTVQLSRANLVLQQEVAERIKTAASLQAVTERLHMALKAAQAGTWRWDIADNKITVDDYLPPLFGLPQGPHHVNLTEDIHLIHPDDREKMTQVFKKAIEASQAYDTEFRVIWSDTSVHVIASRGEVHYDKNNQAIGMTGVCWDITERKRAEDWLYQHQQELAQVSRLSSMGEMGSALAHELNQPLTAITTYTQGCIRRLENHAYQREDVLNAMQIVAEQAERAGTIIHRMKDFVRKGKTASELLRIPEVIKDATNLIHYECRAQTVSFQCEIEEELPPITADKIQIEQVLINLIRNAIEAMQEAKIKDPLIKITACLHNMQTIEINVIDNGPGFPAELTDKLLTPYFTTKTQGMGMGLSISRTIIETLGGKLIPKTLSQGGAWFQLVLPILLEDHDGKV